MYTLPFSGKGIEGLSLAGKTVPNVLKAILYTIHVYLHSSTDNSYRILYCLPPPYLFPLVHVSPLIHVHVRSHYIPYY